ncbi:unnamed protein product [Acanthoscelides obtectus]|uniref:Uncharacterized protein n=1 Tax=Acanthoscelides obtectus TaxID=200917 RepID=A0A9P0M4X1_ACAOB|nr:unnamed protein product [Acanthoscelides obtectus]CAK1627087.1 hypothetical protein AOBTE_LOCUS4293 [Acanthoscelides obtectus]
MEGDITNNEPTIADFITQTAAGVNIRRVNPATPPVAVPGTSRMSPTPSDVPVPGASRERVQPPATIHKRVRVAGQFAVRVAAVRYRGMHMRHI